MWYNEGMENLNLLHYIEQARKSGMEDSKIREGMMQSGLPANEIDEAFNKEASPDFVKQNRGSSIFSQNLSNFGKIGTTSLQKWIAIIGTIIILGMAGAYAYVSYQASKNYNEVTRQAKLAQEEYGRIEQERLANSSTSSGQVSSDWKLYRNEEYGFEFRYPVLGVEQRVIKDSETTRGLVVSFNLEYRAEGKDYFETAYSFGVLHNPDKLSLQEYYVQNECFSPEPTEDCGPSYVIKDFLSPSAENIVRIYFNGQTHELNLYGYDTNEKIDKLSNQILFTFRFLENN